MSLWSGSILASYPRATLDDQSTVLGKCREHIASAPLFAQIANPVFSVITVALHVQALCYVVTLSLFPVSRTRLARGWNSPVRKRPVSSTTFDFVPYQSHTTRKCELGKCIYFHGKVAANIFVAFEYLSHWLLWFTMCWSFCGSLGR